MLIIVQSVEKGRIINNFDKIPQLAPNGAIAIDLSIDFALQPNDLRFVIQTGNKGSYPVSIAVPIGELLLSLPLSVEQFKKTNNDLSGFNTETEKINQTFDSNTIVARVSQCANLALVSSSDLEHCFAGRTRSPTSQTMLVRIIKNNENQTVVSCACEKTLFVHSICAEIVKALTSA